ncbi:hypothetical protein [Desulfovibrio sp.]|uniref:MotE family protein n=1 Tax=Desulfovibrio sp. TaxID=885 RepID=UPI0025B88223|nr:hypothetical protein [Desulfovibrio sp.]
MTKQPPSATKLRLSKLFRWLAVLCFIKLAMLAMLLLDVPLPAWLESRPAQVASNEPLPADTPSDAEIMERLTALVAASQPQGHEAPGLSSDHSPASSASTAPEPSPADPAVNHNPTQARGEAHGSAPQGAEAARLAAAARPRQHGNAPATGRMLDADALPAPLVAAGVHPADPAALQIFTPDSMDHPAPLPAPLAQPGISAPRQDNVAASANAEDKSAATRHGWLESLWLAGLPVPALGSVQAAHAAALDMPVPQAPSSAPTSPFAPAEQAAPYSLPGAPDIPANIPRGQSTDGAPLPPRGASGPNSFGSAAGAGAAAIPALPQSNQPGLPAVPPPAVRPAPSGTDPNLKAQELARQQQDILMLRQQMDQRLKDIQNAEQKMKDMIREARGIEDEKIRRLVLTYTQMKPKAAAKALESMDERVAVRILTGMSPKQSGDILTYVNPAKTAKLTEIITRMKLPE